MRGGHGARWDFYGIGPGSDRGGHLLTHLSRVVIVPGQPGQGAMSNDHFNRQARDGDYTSFPL
ncbi:hypothetical protein KAM347_41590 [Aeromonas caviae]|nr:hypothetical protein KAM347_41590 [Aeromonas caviae]GJA61180.1 hypothetical protein KAM350_41730 [Aeromonas caviae]GJA70189.1 hypothetical protein KAM352_41650 [Aeromonas caviae]GJB05117.1 hypothetical protein KAM360_40600 [Aeromonas caviae]GJB98529.1 hypothetical protein KAM383_41090 [Aeromonas caviae]